ncbi:alpha/beta-hydrolase [Dacryopinax primogenitus]|uniref:Alpha/beta-hydrolase n=1 Tax=Dacryopinax primogenitus (strain DJM 731) TaxID=1858805 RepID=M5FTS1_DACPD|nr:alpha/beta-hydrolase [Dacryopinax primogenitus]EJT98839.1 alpha/beta-hydrolase [Dacryopinax primogenitus]
MPYLDFPEDDISVFYKTNFSMQGDVPLLDRSKRTVLLLPGTIFDVSSGLINQFNDPQLSDSYNLIAFDLRSAGKTICSPCELRDSWVDAALLIKCLVRLQFPAVHVFAPCVLSIHAALRMALLWPDRILSLGFISIQREEEEEWVAEAWRDLVQMLTTAPNLETQEEAINEMLGHTFYEGLPLDQQDRWAQYVETQYPPARTARFLDFTLTVFQRTNLTPEQMAMIKQPVNIISGDSFVCPRADAENLHRQFVNASGGAQLHIIPNGPEQLYFPRPFYPTVNSLYVTFISELASPPAGPGEPSSLYSGLQGLARLMHDPRIAERDSNKVASFSCLTLEKREERKTYFTHALTAQQGAFDPVGPNGEMPRKFSERHLQQQIKQMQQMRDMSRRPSGTLDSNWTAGVKVSTNHDA